MSTCEQCGADAVDARGICRNCGWQARENSYTSIDDAPSLGETRAADVPPGGYATSGAASPSARNSSMNPYPTESRTATQMSGSATSGGRFCGACGARLESGIAFCGQCGAPVASSAANGVTFGSSRPLGQDQYRVGGWSDGDGNDLTEAMLPGAGAPAYNGFGRSGVGPGMPYNAAPYHQSGFAPGTATTPARSTHMTRLVIGVLCLIGSIISASTAIILAITMSH